MGLVRTWWRQVARAAGASLIAPLVLLLAAGVVASGGGLGGLDSLGQIASGPSLPDTGLETASRSSIKDADLVGAPGPPASAAGGPAESSTQTASATRPTAAPSVARPAPRVQTGAGSPAEPPTEAAPLADRGAGTVLDESARRPPPDGADGILNLGETTRGLGEALGEPLQPITNPLVDILVLLGLPPR